MVTINLLYERFQGFILQFYFFKQPLRVLSPVTETAFVLWSLYLCEQKTQAYFNKQEKGHDPKARVPELAKTLKGHLV